MNKVNKDWNYAHMWDKMRRALEESDLEGLEVTPRDVLNGMYTLEALEDLHLQEREEREKHRIREMQMMFDVEIELYPDGRIEICANEERGETKAEGAKECE